MCQPEREQLMPANLPPVNEDAATEAPETGPSYKFLRFYSQKANFALDVVQAVGRDVQDGHPVLSERVPSLDAKGNPLMDGDKVVYETKITDVKKAPFVILEELQYWAAKPTTAPYDPVGAWLTPQDFGATYKSCKVKEAYVAQVLLLTKGGPVLALAEVNGTKSPFVSSSIEAQREAATKEFVKANPAVSKAHPRVRQVGRFNIVPKTGGFGPWSIAKANFDPISEGDLKAIDAWLSDSGKDAERATFAGLFAEKVKSVKALAEKTPAL